MYRLQTKLILLRLFFFNKTSDDDAVERVFTNYLISSDFMIIC